MKQVTGTDAEEITIATNGQNVQTRVGHLQALGNRQRTPMNTVKAERLHEVREATGTANARYNYRLIWWQLETCQAAVGGIEYTEVTAPRAPGWFYFTFIVFRSKSNSRLCHD